MRMRNRFSRGLRARALLVLLSAAAFSGGCGSDGTSGGTSGGGGAGAGTGAGGAGGAAPVESCKTVCGILNKCAGAEAAACEQGCVNSAGNACGTELRAWLSCAAANEPELSMCGLATVCDAQFKAFATCQEQQSPTDAASTSSGAGGGMGDCDKPSCGIGVGGLTCGCTETCGGELRESHCENALGTSVCACSKGGAYLGSCFGSSACELEQSCCASHF